MIEVNKGKLENWNETVALIGWGGLAKITKLSGLSQPTVLRALREGRGTHKTIIAIDRAMARVRKEYKSANVL